MDLSWVERCVARSVSLGDKSLLMFSWAVYEIDRLARGRADLLASCDNGVSCEADFGPLTTGSEICLQIIRHTRIS